jgi:hypothetical protein
MRRTGQTIILSGMLAGVPYQGGATWAVLQYVLGLKRLGHTVYVVEPLTEAALQPAGSDLAHSSNAAYFRQIVAEFGLEQTAALLQTETRQSVGIPYERLRHIARHTDVLINISGMLVDEALIGHIPRRVYLDLDPAFTQLWHVAQGIDMRFAQHTHFVTIGLAIGQAGCLVPTCDVPWITTLQPIVLEKWPVATGMEHDALTTVGNWRSYGSILYQGLLYGQKAHTLRQMFELPTLTSERFILALAIHSNEQADLAALYANGWQLIDPARYTHSPDSYQRFIQGSMAEFGFAKSGYITGRCGWFSDRSICYLASGRPVIAQDTGFSPFLPTGAGLFAFETIDEVLDSIAALRGNYTYHARAARALAEAYFDSDKVLVRLLDQIGAHT